MLLAATVGVVSFVCVLLTTVGADHYDDAFITYVFARNWANGYGIAWVSADAPLYAATSLTYTALLSAVARLRLDVVAASAVLGAIGWGMTSLVLVVLLRRRLG